MAPPPPPERPRRRGGPKPVDGERRGRPPRDRDERPRGDRKDPAKARDANNKKHQPPPAQRGKQPPKSWGGVARRGSRNVQDPPPGSAARVWREAVARARGEKEPEPWEPEVWIQEPDPPRAAKPAKTKPQPARTKAAGQPRNLRKPKRGADRLPDDVRSEIAGAPGAKRSPRIQERLGEAARAYERDRYRDALQLLRPLADQAPEAGAVRELLGLTLYRLGRWTAAIKELETFHTLTGSYDQHPPLADCYRALKRWRKVNEVWEELRTASPSAELVAEGRLVVAGSLADRGEVGEAIKLLESAPGIDRSARVQDHHLRLWYALGDLYERAGEVPRARDLFRRVADRDPDVYDVGERLANLS